MSLSIGDIVYDRGNGIGRTVSVANARRAALLTLDVLDCRRSRISALRSSSASGASDRDLCSSREIVFNRQLNTNERGR